MTLQELIKTNSAFFTKNWHGKAIKGHMDLEIGEGWYPLVAIVAENAPKGVYAQCIKEKFGCLRIYCGDNDEKPCHEFNRLVADIEQKSSEVCENCGSEENVTVKSGNNSSWIKTYCEKCHGERK